MPLAHTIVGPQDAPVVVFLHGFLGGKCDWATTTNLLDEDFRCVSLDLPGHGESAGDPNLCSMEYVATKVIELVDSLDAGSFSMVGYSMGGRIALYVSSIYAMRVDAIVLESTSPGLKTESERAARREQDERWAQMVEIKGMVAFLDAWYEQPLFESLASRPKLIERVKAKRLKNEPRAVARALRGFSVGRQTPLWDEWDGNQVPALLVAGELDAKYCAVAREMEQTCSACRVAIVPGAGHNVHEEAPNEYNSAIHTFLRETIKV
ncbi:MAG: 2-succinyl-6-hydroxy-2,4-cyclohexadiene-1-carboxylate synthase [Candidatus Hydrogenedentes bacterium]|nr:2-succinyl-6-hydroxy-2,4-cyclohexadiene-1-carboxylate synthase [Candidatus Hydrogenedentota bacterium]